MNIAKLLDRLISQAADARQNTAQQTEYSEVESALDELGEAVATAKTLDEGEAQNIWTEWARLWKHLTDFGAERERFFNDARILKEAADTYLDYVRETTRERVGEHREVPATLVEDAAEWSRRALQVRTMALRAKSLEAPEGWTGSAREEYSSAALVQRNALAELEGIMESTANGCELGASLNKAVFFVVKEAISGATGRIKGADAGTGGVYYARTAVARNECRQLWYDILAAVGGDVVSGTANGLASDISAAVEAPNLLQLGSWPTGTGGAGTEPARTNTVPSDGDANLDPDGYTTGGGSTGVDL